MAQTFNFKMTREVKSPQVGVFESKWLKQSPCFMMEFEDKNYDFVFIKFTNHSESKKIVEFYVKHPKQIHESQICLEMKDEEERKMFLQVSPNSNGTKFLLDLSQDNFKIGIWNFKFEGFPLDKQLYIYFETCNTSSIWFKNIEKFFSSSLEPIKAPAKQFVFLQESKKENSELFFKFDAFVETQNIMKIISNAAFETIEKSKNFKMNPARLQVDQFCHEFWILKFIEHNYNRIAIWNEVSKYSKTVNTNAILFLEGQIWGFLSSDQIEKYFFNQFKEKTGLYILRFAASNYNINLTSFTYTLDHFKGDLESIFTEFKSKLNKISPTICIYPLVRDWIQYEKKEKNARYISGDGKAVGMD